MEGFRRLAVVEHSSVSAPAVRTAAEDAGLVVLELPAHPDQVALLAAPDLAWRIPSGLAAALRARGLDLPLTAPPPEWVAGLPAEVTGRRLAVATAEAVRRGEVGLSDVRMVKPAHLKLREFPAQRVADLAAARNLVGALPPDTRLLLADGWLECDSEYRVFTHGRAALTCSPYLVEGEAYSRELFLSRASFHEQALAFAQQLLDGLAEQEVPPACVLDVARLPGGRLVLLEVNTSWGAGTYGCDPDLVLRSVLAANEPADPCWRWLS